MTTATKPTTKPTGWDWEDLKKRGWKPTDCAFGCPDDIPVRETEEGIEIMPSTRADDDWDCHWSHKMSQPYHVRCLVKSRDGKVGPQNAGRRPQVKRLTAIIIEQEVKIERLEDLHFFREEDIDEAGECWFSNEQPSKTVLRYTQDWVDDHRQGTTAGAFETLVLRIRERLEERRIEK